MARLVKQDFDWTVPDEEADEWVLLPFPPRTAIPRLFEDADDVVIDRRGQPSAPRSASASTAAPARRLARMELRVALEEWLAPPRSGWPTPMPCLWSVGGPRRAPQARCASADQTGRARGGCDDVGGMGVTSPFSPFVGPIEPIAGPTARSRRCWRRRDAPLSPPSPTSPATCRCYVTTSNPTPDAGDSSGGSTSRTRRRRELALRSAHRFRDDGSVAAPPPSDVNVLKIIVFRRRRGHGRLPCPPGGGARHPRRGSPGAQWHATPTRRLPPRSSLGAGISGLLMARGLQRAACTRGHREERRRWWHPAGEPLCGLRSTSRTATTATRSRSGNGRCTSPLKTCCSTTSGAAPTRSGCGRHIRFDTEVVSATWSEADGASTVRVKPADSPEELLVANTVVSAVGQLNRPSLSGHPGRDTFADPSCHSARWNHRPRPPRQHVAVIGTGTSGSQLIPEVAAGDRWAAGVSAHTALIRADGGLPRSGVARTEVAVRHVPSYSEWNSAYGSSGRWAMVPWPTSASTDEFEPKGGAVGAEQQTRADDAHPVLSTWSSPTGPTSSSTSCRRTRLGRSGCCATTACGPAR